MRQRWIEELIYLGWTITLISSHGSFSICLSIDERRTALFVHSWHLVRRDLSGTLTNLYSSLTDWHLHLYSGKHMVDRGKINPNDSAQKCTAVTVTLTALNKWECPSLLFFFTLTAAFPHPAPRRKFIQKSTLFSFALKSTRTFISSTIAAKSFVKVKIPAAVFDKTLQ